MPTNKRKMNRKRWKKTKITSKRSNDRLGFNTFVNKQKHGAVRAMNAFEQPHIVNSSTGLKTHAHHQSHALFMRGGQLIVV